VLGRYLRDRSDWQSGVPLASSIVILIVTAPAKLDEVGVIKEAKREVPRAAPAAVVGR
jgi:hypothetical protein